MHFRLSARLGVPLLVAAVGCGLISSDITKLTFDLPPKTYTFDSAGFAGAVAGIPPVPCGGSNVIQDCCNPPAQVPVAKPDCAAHPLVCEASLCTLKQPVTVKQTMNLKMEVPELSSVGDNQSLANISLAKMHYDAVSTLNVDVPDIELFLAPANVTDPTDPTAVKFGTVPSIPKGMTVSGDVIKEPGADDLFASYGHAFGTPFNFIASTTVTIASGSPTPSGSITVTVAGKVSAKLDL